MLRKPPHILVTTPESLFILLTAEKSRAMLSTARTVIVDEIHAVADDKRGSHLALSLVRLERLARPEAGSNGRPKRLQRIGLSATVKPIEQVASFLSETFSRDPAAGTALAPGTDSATHAGSGRIIQGGRFVEAFVGEQFALPEAVELLRSVRRSQPDGEEIEIAASDPLNLVGTILPGSRVSAAAAQTIRLKDGVVVEQVQSAILALAAAGMPEEVQ